MLRQIIASSRYLICIAVAGTFLASLAVLVYEGMVMVEVMVNAIRAGVISTKSAKELAVALIEAVDVFLIAIVAYIISLGLYALFVDDTLPVPHWLEIHDLDDLKNHLVSVVVAVLAVLFLREAVSRIGELDLLRLAAALAIMIATLTFFLAIKRHRRNDSAD